MTNTVLANASLAQFSALRVRGRWAACGLGQTRELHKGDRSYLGLGALAGV